MVSIARSAVMGAAAMMIAATAMPAPASAEGLLEAIFGGIGRALSPEPTPQAPVEQPRPRRSESSGGGGTAYCVRTCDGRYFQIPRQSRETAASACNSFCPASQTKVFSGGQIDNAVAYDGTRYADLPNAFVYRQKVVADCTCNGRTPFGLASIPLNQDATMRQGDIVANADGFVVYRGSERQDGTAQAQFTPIGSYASLSAEMRRVLAATEVDTTHATPTIAPLPPTTVGGAAARRGSGDAKRAQLSRQPATSSASDRELVSPGDSMPNR